MANSNPTSVKVHNPKAKAAPAKATKGGHNSAVSPSAKTANNYEIRWKTLLGLSMILIELVLNTGFIWGLFGLFWVITNIQTGQTYILEPLHRANNPVLFWITVYLWIGFSAYFFYSNNWVFQQLELGLIWLVKLVV